MKIQYREIKFRSGSLRLIEQVNQIIEDYQELGYSLTLRQVYYQLVAQDVIPNTERSYKNLGNLIADGRIAGLIDWTAIEDRTRNLRGNAHWDTPGDIISSAARQFAYNKWSDQDYYVEVWVEKDALVGIVGQICSRLDVPFFSCRGYVSISEMWSAAERLKERSQDHFVVILHLGDHDPSGKDMSRDIVERLQMFQIQPLFKRIALNMDQIEQYNPPPNPTKLSDSRSTGYIEDYGYECWELDALRPEVIESLIREHVLQYCDMKRFEHIKALEHEAKAVLQKVSANWTKIEGEYGI